VIANEIIAKVGDNGQVEVYNHNGTVDVLFDVVGYLPDTADYDPLTPVRILDTRNDTGGPAAKIGAGESRTVAVTGVGGVPASGVGAVVLNVPAANATEQDTLTLDSDVESVAEALTLGRAYNTASLDAPVSQDEPDGDTIMDLQADEGSPIDGLEDKILLQEAIGGLKDQQQQILKLRYNEGKTQTEIADHIGVSQMHVSRLLRRALEDLRRELDELENNH
jgi:RNA polymerase sigma factor (sigma-70 family)